MASFSSALSECLSNRLFKIVIAFSYSITQIVYHKQRPAIKYRG
jgi:hypothetical protein